VAPGYFPPHARLFIIILDHHLIHSRNSRTVTGCVKFLDFLGGFVYYETSITKLNFFIFRKGCAVIQVNQEELQEKIKKLKQAAAEKISKAGGKKSEPAARKARKKVKRAQRKLRSAKAYKSAGKKAATAAAPAEGKATA
jgi:hypothetical protein